MWTYLQKRAMISIWSNESSLTHTGNCYQIQEGMASNLEATPLGASSRHCPLILTISLTSNLYAEYIMRNAGLEEAQAGIKIARRNINNLRYADDPYGSKWRGTKKPLDESESGEWKSWLKAQRSENEGHGIRSHHSMGNRWRNSGNSVTLFFGAPKSLQMVTVAMKLKDTYSLEGKLWPT